MTNAKANHTEAVHNLIQARDIAPHDPYPRAYLGFVYGQPLLRDYGACAEHLLAGLDG